MIRCVSQEAASAPDDVYALCTALSAEQSARREAEARASGAEAMVAHLKLLIAKLRHDRLGASSERGRKLPDQIELTALVKANLTSADHPFRQKLFPKCGTSCSAHEIC